MILTGVEVIPFTVVDKEFAPLVLLTEFTAEVDAATPFTVDVIVLAVLLMVLVVTAGAAFVGAQLVPFQESTWPDTGAVEETALPCNWFAFQYAAVLLMVAVVDAVVTAAAVVAVTVPILLLNVVQFAALNLPLFVADATGKLNVCTFAELEILKSVPVVPVANVCTEPVKPFKEVSALPDSKPATVLVVTFPELSAVNTFVSTVLVPNPANLTVPVVCS